MNIAVIFGAMSDPLADQLPSWIPKETVDQLQRKADAITMLNVHALLSESETKKSRKRLMRHIVTAYKFYRKELP